MSDTINKPMSLCENMREVESFKYFDRLGGSVWQIEAVFNCSLSQEEKAARVWCAFKECPLLAEHTKAVFSFVPRRSETNEK